VNQYAPLYRNSLYVSQFPAFFPSGTDQIPYFVNVWFGPSLVPGFPNGATIRSIGNATTAGYSKYSLNRYLRERGDANIQSVTDPINKSHFWTDIRPDANFGDRKAALQSTNSATTLSFTNFFANRFAYQVIVLKCMADMHLDAMVSSCGSIPAYVLGQPVEPTLNGRGRMPHRRARPALPTNPARRSRLGCWVAGCEAVGVQTREITTNNPPTNNFGLQRGGNSELAGEAPGGAAELIGDPAAAEREPAAVGRYATSLAANHRTVDEEHRSRQVRRRRAQRPRNYRSTPLLAATAGGRRQGAGWVGLAIRTSAATPSRVCSE
jgi:hypothetical protein